MADEIRDEPATEVVPASSDEYAAFIAQIRLRHIWLVSSRVDNRAGPKTPEHARIRTTNRASWEPIEGGFHAASHYRVRVTSESNDVLAILEAVFAVEYTSGDPMTESLFVTFGEFNLPLNTWPFLREFVATSIGRMNWLPFTLPALKRGIGATSRNGQSRRSSTSARGTGRPSKRE